MCSCVKEKGRRKEIYVFSALNTYTVTILLPFLPRHVYTYILTKHTWGKRREKLLLTLFLVSCKIFIGCYVRNAKRVNVDLCHLPLAIPSKRNIPGRPFPPRLGALSCRRATLVPSFSPSLLSRPP